MPVKLIPISVAPIESRLKGKPVDRNLRMTMKYTLDNCPIVREMPNITVGQYIDFHDFMNTMGLHYIYDELSTGISPYLSEAERRVSHNEIRNEFIDNFQKKGREIIPFDTPTLWEMASDTMSSADKFLVRIKKLLGTKHSKKYVEITKQITDINDKLYKYDGMIADMDKELGGLKELHAKAETVEEKNKIAEKHNLLSDERNKLSAEYNRLLVEVYQDRVETQHKLAKKVCEYIDPKGQIQFNDIYGGLAKPVKKEQVDKYYRMKNEAGK